MDRTNSNARKNIFLLVTVLTSICLLMVVVESRFKLARRGYDHFIMDNRNHYLSCEELPPGDNVERIVEQHEDVIQQIQQVAPGFVGVEIDSFTCEGKADLILWYGTHEQRVAIEEIIGSDTFFGIPYRLQNR
jgi:hypothetical protein